MKERVYRYRAREREIVRSRPGMRVLDVGCGRGENLRRLARYGGVPLGVDPNRERLREAASEAPVAAAAGEQLPCAAEAFEMVYISHALHHADDVRAVLRESYRALAPGGLVFVLESIDDSPLMRLARAVQPSWQDDPVRNRFRYANLAGWLEEEGFEMRAGKRFNWMYFIWEMAPMAFRPLDLLSPLFIGLESLLQPLLGRFGGHCWLVAEKPGPPLFPSRLLETGERATAQKGE